jgi:transcriptional regulator with XRE-family HTH domain
MDFDYARLQAAVIDACGARGWTQAELIEKSNISRSTIQRIWRAEPTKPGRRTQRLLEQALGWEQNSVMAVLRGGAPAVIASTARPSGPETAEANRRGSLIDPHSPDPVIRELSTGPVAGGDEFREQLIRLYLDDVEEGQRWLRKRAAERALKLAAASLGQGGDAEAELRRLDRLAELQREIEAEDKAQNSDTAGNNRDLA